jgi:hypothetical protein
MTLAQQRGITDFPYIITDKKGREVYWENHEQFWIKKKYDALDHIVFYENSNRTWYRREFDSDNNLVYYEDCTGLIIGERKGKLNHEVIQVIL